MRRHTLFSFLGILAVAVVTASGASAGTRVYVELAGRDDAAPKRARPGISVRVVASDDAGAASVAAELERELTHQVDTQPLAGGELGDYALVVTLDPPRAQGAALSIRFEASLQSAGGRRLWRIEGRSDVEAEPLDAAVYSGISRNVISALVHDGWVQPLYDPDDPPPPPPTLWNQDARR